MPILKPDSALKSWSRKLSQRQSVRLPWAIVVPKGLSFFARSTSTWIHWWSSETSANLSMSSWVTSRQSLGPICRPISAFSSSIPFTVVGVLMARSISAVVVPGLRLQRLAKRLRPSAHDRLSVRHEDILRTQLEQRPHGGREPLSVEGRHLLVNLVRPPHHEPAARLGDGIAEDERAVARDVERHLVAARLADRVSGDAAGQLSVGVGGVEGGVVRQPLRAGGMAVDGGLGLPAVALPELLGAPHVVRDRDQ